MLFYQIWEIIHVENFVDVTEVNICVEWWIKRKLVIIVDEMEFIISQGPGIVKQDQQTEKFWMEMDNERLRNGLKNQQS